MRIKVIIVVGLLLVSRGLLLVLMMVALGILGVVRVIRGRGLRQCRIIIVQCRVVVVIIIVVQVLDQVSGTTGRIVRILRRHHRPIVIIIGR